MGGVAVLFWCYRDLPVCQNRLDQLRRHSPGVAIFGVYGGDPAGAERFRRGLGDRLDDFWAFERPASAKWKWRHGDLMLAEWFEARGRHLEWGHVFVAQWDLLVLQALDELLPPLAPDDVLLPAVRPVAALEPHWVWARGGHEADYRAFVDAVTARFGPVEPMSCVFAVACLPRRLFEAYCELPDPETGFVEYRLPTLAAAVQLRFVHDERFDAWRPADVGAGRATRRQKLLNGSRRAVLLPTVLRELAQPGGARMFHPYHGLFPSDVTWAAKAPAWAAFAAARAARDAIAARVASR